MINVVMLNGRGAVNLLSIVKENPNQEMQKKHRTKILTMPVLFGKRCRVSQIMADFSYQDKTWARFSTLEIAMCLQHIYVVMK